MFDWPQHLQETAQWLVTMHAVPGFREHAQFRAEQLKEEPGYETLPALIRALRKANERKPA